MVRILGDRATLWLREDKTVLQHEVSVAQFKYLAGKVTWFDREQMKVLYPTMRFGLRRTTTVLEDLNNENYVYNPHPSSIASAINVLTR